MIYISAHPADFQAHFQSIRQDLFDLTQCILYYDPDPDHPEDLSRFVSDLSQMNLIILPITQKFLREESFARDWILQLVEKLHLPFLPICADQDVFPFLQKYIPAFHALARFCEDPKEPSFLQKLQDYLNTLFPSSRQIQDVQAALSQNLWMQNVDTRCSDPFNDSGETLCYRFPEAVRFLYSKYSNLLAKRTESRTAAQETIQSDPFPTAFFSLRFQKSPGWEMQCFPFLKQDAMLIPVWQLTQKKMLDADPCRIFCLEDSFGFQNQKENETLHFPVLNPADPKNPFPDSAQQLYRTGLACMNGIGRPIDYEKGIVCLQKAAEMNHTSAMDEMIFLHLYGKGVPASLNEAIQWAEKRVEVHPDYPSHLLAARLRTEKDQLHEAVLHALDALSCLDSVNPDPHSRFVEDDPAVLEWKQKSSWLFRFIAELYMRQKDFSVSKYYISQSLVLDQEILKIRESNGQNKSIWPENADLIVPNNEEMDRIRQHLWATYLALGEIARQNGRNLEAERSYRHADELSVAVLGHDSSSLALYHFSYAQECFGDLYFYWETLYVQHREDMLIKAKSYYEDALSNYQRLLEHRIYPRCMMLRRLRAVFLKLSWIYRDQDLFIVSAYFAYRGLQMAKSNMEEFCSLKTRQEFACACLQAAEAQGLSKNWDKAEAYYSRALRMYDELKENSPSLDLQRYEAESLAGLGDVFCARQKTEEAIELYQKSCTILQSLYGENRTVEGIRSLCIQLDRLVKAYLSLNDLEQALRINRIALDQAEWLNLGSQIYADCFLFDRITYRQACIETDLHLYEQADEHASQALSLFAMMYDINKTSFHYFQAGRTWNLLSRIALEQEEYADAEENAWNALVILLDVRKELESQDLLFDLEQCLNVLKVCAWQSGDGFMYMVYKNGIEKFRQKRIARKRDSLD